MWNNPWACFMGDVLCFCHCDILHCFWTFFSWTRHFSHPLCRWAHPRWGSPSSWWRCTCWKAVALLSAVCGPPSRWETSPSSSRRPETAARPRAWPPAAGRGCRVWAGRTAAERTSTLPRSAPCSPPRTCRSCCPLSLSLQRDSRPQTLSLLLK